MPAPLSLLTVNALTAADEALIPVVPDYLASRGLGLLLTVGGLLSPVSRVVIRPAFMAAA